MAYMKFEDAECDDIKEYCPWEGCPCTLGPDGPIMCEGAWCKEAYDRWVEERVVACERCGQEVDRYTCNIYKDDCHTYYMCEDCEAIAE